MLHPLQNCRRTKTSRTYLATDTDRIAAAFNELPVDCRDATGDGLNRLEYRVQNGLFQMVRIEVRHIDLLFGIAQIYERAEKKRVDISIP